MRDGRALREHCANCDRPDILPLVISTEPIGCLVEAMGRVRGGALPLNYHCRDDQQPEKERQQYRGYEPLTNSKTQRCSTFRTVLQNGGSATLSQSPITARGTRGDRGHMLKPIE